MGGKYISIDENSVTGLNGYKATYDKSTKTLTIDWEDTSNVPNVQSGQRLCEFDVDYSFTAGEIDNGNWNVLDLKGAKILGSTVGWGAFSAGGPILSYVGSTAGSELITKLPAMGDDLGSGDVAYATSIVGYKCYDVENNDITRNIKLGTGNLMVIHYEIHRDSMVAAGVEPIVDAFETGWDATIGRII